VAVELGAAARGLDAHDAGVEDRAAAVRAAVRDQQRDLQGAAGPADVAGLGAVAPGLAGLGVAERDLQALAGLAGILQDPAHLLRGVGIEPGAEVDVPGQPDELAVAAEVLQGPAGLLGRDQVWPLEGLGERLGFLEAVVEAEAAVAVPGRDHEQAPLGVDGDFFAAHGLAS